MFYLGIYRWLRAFFYERSEIHSPLPRWSPGQAQNFNSFQNSEMKKQKGEKETLTTKAFRKKWIPRIALQLVSILNLPKPFPQRKINSSLFCVKTREGAEIPNPSSPYSLFEKLQILLKSIKATIVIQKKRKVGTYPLWTCCLVQ